jgi:hypothetical protein
MGGRAVTIAVVVVAASALIGCGDPGASSGTSASSSSSAPTTTVVTTTPATTAPPSTAAPATSPGSSEVPASTAPTPQSACPGPATIPSAATQLAAINGDIDGDTMNDVVTSYSLDGVPHVHATLATGGNSDAEVPIGFANTVSISFLDFDHSLGAEVPPPVAVLAIGATKAGTAVGAFLTLTPGYCIGPWHDGDHIFTFRISAEPPYQGLFCDGAMGSIIHSLSTAEQNPGGDWTITLAPFGHNFTTVDLHGPDSTFVVPDGPDVRHDYGDLTSCGLTLFP